MNTYYDNGIPFSVSLVDKDNVKKSRQERYERDHRKTGKICPICASGYDVMHGCISPDDAGLKLPRNLRKT